MGANPAEITKGSPYIDLGATVLDPAWGTTPANSNLGAHASGLEAVNTSIVGTYIITYTAQDQAGNSATATRSVIVMDSTTSQQPIIEESTQTETGSASSTPPTSEPAPTATPSEPNP